MHCAGRLTAFVILLILVWPAFAKRPYTPEVTAERYVSTQDVRADGTYRETTEFVLRVETPQGIPNVGAQRIHRI